MNNKEIIDFYIEQGLLIGPDMLAELSDKSIPIKHNFAVINLDTLNASNSKKPLVILDFEKAIVQKEKYRNKKLYDKFIEYISSGSTPKTTSTRQSLTPTLSTQQLAPQSILQSIQSHSQSNTEQPNIVQQNLENQTKDLISSTITSTLSQTPQAPPEDIIDSNTSYQQKARAEDKLIAENKLKLEETENVEKIARAEFYKKHKINIVSSYNSKSHKWAVKDFVSLYNARFSELEKILKSRTELQNLTSISRISAKKERENVAFVGVVYDKGLTKTGNIMLTIEDPTGMIKAVVTKKKEDVFKLAEEIQLDETIGITGMFDQIVFVSNILIPDIPLTKELKKSPTEGYMLILADTQVGSKLFLEHEFNKLISWINGEIGNEKQKEVAANVKYIFIAGDLVDGVGIYPNQEYDLSIIDIKDQYKRFAELIKQIPDYIPIIICPGNHDIGRISEPQPPLSKEYIEPILNLSNVISVSNPATINIYAQPEFGFDGFNVMLYHGYSFVYYSEHIPLIRKAGGQKRPDLIMKYLLSRRHLAPSHTSTLYIPDPKKDPLMIDKVPDFLISGHVHRSSVSNYKNVTCFNASCWVSQSDEQERRGLEAQPARAFIVNLQTREVKIMNFLSKDDQEKEDQRAAGIKAAV